MRPHISFLFQAKDWNSFKWTIFLSFFAIFVENPTIFAVAGLGYRLITLASVIEKRSFIASFEGNNSVFRMLRRRLRWLICSLSYGHFSAKIRYFFCIKWPIFYEFSRTTTILGTLPIEWRSMAVVKQLCTIIFGSWVCFHSICSILPNVNEFWPRRPWLSFNNFSFRYWKKVIYSQFWR